MGCQAIKIQRKLKCMMLSERSQSKRLPTIWFQLCDTLGNAKLQREWKPVIARIEGSGRMNGQSTKDFQEWNYSLWYCNHEHMPLYICVNPKNVQHQEWILVDYRLWTIALIWAHQLWEIDQSHVEVDKKRGYASVGVGGILETSASSLEFFCESKMIKSLKKLDSDTWN